jgi:hypothetical protein
MAQPRPSRAHVTGWIVALALLAAAPAGTLGISSLDHTTRLAGGIPFFHSYRLMWVAVAAVLSALACLLSRQTVPVVTVHGPRGATRQSEARRLS